MLDLAGPPHQIHLDEALERRTLPELLALWLARRQWARDEQAERFELLAYELEVQAAIAQVKDPARAVAHLRKHAEALRQPEFAPPRRLRLSAAQRRFFRPLIRELAPERRALYEEG